MAKTTTRPKPATTKQTAASGSAAPNGAPGHRQVVDVPSCWR